MNGWAITHKVAWIVLIVVLVLATTLYVFSPKWKEIRELQRRRASYENEKWATERHIEDLVRKQKRFQSDPEYVERVAREQGRFKLSETVFKFTNATSEAESR